MEGKVQHQDKHRSFRLKTDLHRWWVYALAVAVVTMGALVGIFWGIQIQPAENVQTAPTVKTTPKALNEKNAAAFGTVTHALSDEAIAGASVTLEQETTTTDVDGKFFLRKLPAAPVTLNISKGGFLKQTKELSAPKKDLGAFKVVPEGRVIFVSNRDGRPGIYTCNYDGSDQKLLLERTADQKDYRVVRSPDGALMVFYSSRETKKQANSEQKQDQLFLAETDGSDIQRISDDTIITSVFWTKNSDNVLYFGSESGSGDDTIVQYNVQADTRTRLQPPAGERVQSNFLAGPDGKSLFFLTYINVGDTYTYTLYRSNFDGSDLQKIDFSSKYIYIDSASERDNTIIFNKEGIRYQYNLQSKEIAQIDTSSDSSITVYLSSAADRIAFADRRDGKSNLFVADGNRKNEIQITVVGGVNSNGLEWILDDQFILYNSVTENESARYVVAVKKEAKPHKIADVFFEGGGD